MDMTARNKRERRGMPEHVIFRGVQTAAVRNSIRDYWARKWRRLERLLTPFPPDQRHLRLTVHDHDPVYDVRAVLMLPTGTLVANGGSRRHDFRQAIDVAADRLAEEIRRHKGLLRHDDLYRRKRRRLADLAGVARALEEHRRGGDRQAFMTLLRPALRGLRDHAQHELVLAKLEGTVWPGVWTVSDLLDEVVARAWERFDQRPAGEPMERWLTLILHEVLDEKRADVPAAASVHDVIPEDDPRFQVDAGWVHENEPFWGELQPLTLEQVLPSHETPEPWQAASAEEQRRWVLSQLRRFPRPQRRAFTLHVLDGWDEDDVAMVQGRSADEVRWDVEEVRRTLRESLLEQPPPATRNAPASPASRSPDGASHG